MQGPQPEANYFTVAADEVVDNVPSHECGLVLLYGFFGSRTAVTTVLER